MPTFVSSEVPTADTIALGLASNIDWFTVYRRLKADHNVALSVGDRSRLIHPNKGATWWRLTHVQQGFKLRSATPLLAPDHVVYSKLGRVVFALLQHESSIKLYNVLYLIALLNCHENLEMISSTENLKYSSAESAVSQVFIATEAERTQNAQPDGDATFLARLQAKLATHAQRQDIIDLVTKKWVPVLTTLRAQFELSHSICGALNYIFRALRIPSPLSTKPYEYLKDKLSKGQNVRDYMLARTTKFNSVQRIDDVLGVVEIGDTKRPSHAATQEAVNMVLHKSVRTFKDIIELFPVAPSFTKTLKKAAKKPKAKRSLKASAVAKSKK